MVAATIYNYKNIHDRTRMLSCIRESIQAIASANRNLDAEERRICLIEYAANHRRAIQSGVSISTINQYCRKQYYLSLAATLQAIAIATITGDYYHNVDELVGWYEQDRQRMIDLGFGPDAIDKRIRKIKIKLTTK